MKSKINLSALFVEPDSIYKKFGFVDCYDEKRNAFTFRGPGPVIAHPPCERWGRYWFGGPSVKVRKKLGDDGGCFEFALRMVNAFGGIIEHPEASKAWAHFGLVTPKRGQGWVSSGIGKTTLIDQGRYGHPAKKATFLYAVLFDYPDLDWKQATNKIRLDEGFHSKAEREKARALGQKPIKRLTAKQNRATPRPFANLLINLCLGKS